MLWHNLRHVSCWLMIFSYGYCWYWIILCIRGGYSPHDHHHDHHNHHRTLCWDSGLGRFLTSSKPNLVTDCWLEGHRTQQLTTTALDHPTWLRNIKGFHKFLWIFMCLIALKYFNFLADLASKIVAAYCESLHFITSPPPPWWAHSSAQPTPTWNSSSKLSGGQL